MLPCMGHANMNIDKKPGFWKEKHHGFSLKNSMRDQLSITNCYKTLKQKACFSVCFKIQIPTRIPEKIVVALFSGILVNSGILVIAYSTN